MNLRGKVTKVKSETETETETKETNVKVFKFPENRSMKNDGDSIEGIYKGILVKQGEGMNEDDLLLAVFEQPDHNLLTCVAGSQVVKFLRGFPTDKYLKITRIGTKQTKKGNPFAVYQFECDISVFLGSGLTLIEAAKLPEVKRLTE